MEETVSHAFLRMGWWKSPSAISLKKAFRRNGIPAASLAEALGKEDGGSGEIPLGTFPPSPNSPILPRSSR